MFLSFLGERKEHKESPSKGIPLGKPLFAMPTRPERVGADIHPESPFLTQKARVKKGFIKNFYVKVTFSRRYTISGSKGDALCRARGFQRGPLRSE